MLAAWTLATFAAEQCTQLRNTSYVHTDLGAAQLRPRLPQGTTVNDFTLPLEEVTPDRARAIFDEFGVLVVRDLAAAYAPRIRAAAEAAFARSLALLEAGHFEAVINGDHTVGWSTPDQTLFIPAPEGHARSKQAMVLALDYFSDASMLQAATDERTLDIVEALLGSPNIELFGKGQCFYKEGMTGASSPGGIDAAMMGRSAMADTSMSSGLRPGGNPKYLHQDSACSSSHFNHASFPWLPHSSSGAHSTMAPSQRHCCCAQTSCLGAAARWRPSRTPSTPRRRGTTAPSSWCPAPMPSATCSTWTRRRTWAWGASGPSTTRCASTARRATRSSSTCTRCTARPPTDRPRPAPPSSTGT